MNEKRCKQVAPAAANSPSRTAHDLVSLLETVVHPQIAELLATVSGAEHAYRTTPTIREHFDDRVAEDAWASLRYHLEQATTEARRIIEARRTSP